MISKDERIIRKQRYRGVEVTFTEHLWKDRGRDCIIIRAYYKWDGWDGGGDIARIYNVDGGYVAVNPFNNLPVLCRQDGQECAKAVLENYKGPSLW